MLKDLLFLFLFSSIAFFSYIVSGRVYNSYFAPVPGTYDYSNTVAYFNGTKLPVPGELKENWATSNVLGSKSTSKDKKRIEINLSKQELYAYEGDNKIFEFKISSGKWGATPKGEFRIWNKIKYTLMAGGNKAMGTYYYLPNVPFTMFFYNSKVPQSMGFGIHGTYWHNNFGNPMSHGCVNMKTEEAEKLFYWANPVIKAEQSSVNATGDNNGTRVIIYGVTPNT